MLPNLPDNLEFLYCHGNKLITPPKIPKNLKRITITFLNYKINNVNKYKKFYKDYMSIIIIIKQIKLPCDIKRKLILDHLSIDNLTFNV
jgi:hypothetical protein